MLDFLRRVFFIILILVFFQSMLLSDASSDKLRIEDYQVFLDDQRIAVRGGSEYHFISDPAIYPLILPDNFDILIEGNTTTTNLLRVWMEGMANTSNTHLQPERSHPILGTEYWPLYAIRERQPFRLTPDSDPRPYCTYDLEQWPDDSWQGQPLYFDRLKDFIEAAEERDVIVMLTLFDACMKSFDPAYWETSAWHPDRNTVTADYLDASNPYPTVPDQVNPKAFYNIWQWDGDRMLKDLNGLGILQRNYVTRVVQAIPETRWNVWFEIENEPKRVIARTSNGYVNLTAKWAYTVAGWIKNARTDSIIAYNAHENIDTRNALFELETLHGQRIDVITLHASYNNTTGRDFWHLIDPDTLHWANIEKIKIENAINRIRDYSDSRFFIIDSDGDSEDDYDLEAQYVDIIAGWASLFGAGYNNKSATITNYDYPSFNVPLLKDLNDACTLPFFDVAGGTKYGLYQTYPDYRRSFFDNNVLRNTSLVEPIIVNIGEPYTLDIMVINNGTYSDFSDIGNNLYLWDKTMGVTAEIEPDLLKVTPPTAWTIPPLNLGTSHKTVVTMSFDALEEETSREHEIVIVKMAAGFKVEIGGDTLRVQVFAQ